MSWTPAGAPSLPVKEYDEAALALRDGLVAQFQRLEARHVAIMDGQLRSYRPLKFDPGLAPVGHVNSPTERQRIVDINERSEAEAEAYRSGEMGTVRTMALLATDSPREMESRACMISFATRIYFVDDTPLLTVETDGRGEVQGVDVPKPASPTLQ